MYIIYGISNCDTVKKTLSWFKENKLPYEFHDYKKNDISPAKLKSWSKQVGWETILNKKGSTWRALDVKIQASINNEKAAIKLLAENTSAIKRPVIEEREKVITVGFDTATYEKLFKK